MGEMIFLIGFPRSGTSLIHEALSHHPSVAWPSNYLSKYPRMYWLNTLAYKVFGVGRKDQFDSYGFLNKVKIKPAEAYPFWNDLFGLNDEFSRTYMKGYTASDLQLNEANERIESLLKSINKTTFISKITGPGRVLFLKAFFPKAKFIHIIRDGRLAANSLIKLPKWDDQQRFNVPWWSDPYINSYRSYWSDNLNLYEKALLLWLEVIENIELELSKVSERDRLVVKYEDFTSNPKKEIDSMIKFADLEDNFILMDKLRQGPPIIQSKKTISSKVISNSIEVLLNSKLKNIGY